LRGPIRCPVSSRPRQGGANARHPGRRLTKMRHRLLDLVRQHRQRIDLPHDRRDDRRPQPSQVLEAPQLSTLPVPHDQRDRTSASVEDVTSSAAMYKYTARLVVHWAITGTDEGGQQHKRSPDSRAHCRSAWPVTAARRSSRASRTVRSGGCRACWVHVLEAGDSALRPVASGSGGSDEGNPDTPAAAALA
jgi:hypothetical protein